MIGLKVGKLIYSLHERSFSSNFTKLFLQTYYFTSKLIQICQQLHIQYKYFPIMNNHQTTAYSHIQTTSSEAFQHSLINKGSRNQSSSLSKHPIHFQSINYNNDNEAMGSNQFNMIQDQDNNKATSHDQTSHRLQYQVLDDEKKHETNRTKLQKNNNNSNYCNDWNKTEVLILRSVLFLMMMIIGGFFILYMSGQNKSMLGGDLNEYNITSIFILNMEEEESFQSLQSYLRVLFEYYKNNQQNRTRIKFNDILVGYHNKFSQQKQEKINKLIDQISKIHYKTKSIKLVWVRDKNLQSDIQFIDKLVHQVTDQYFFLSTAQYIYQYSTQNSNLNLIQYFELSQYVLTSLPKISQLILNQTPHKANNNLTSFSFSPAVHRTKDYPFLGKGFKATMVEAEGKISEYFSSINLQAMRIDNSFGILKQLNNIIKNKPSSEKVQEQNRSVNTMPISTYLRDVQEKIKKPRQIFELKQLNQIKQLPICLVIVPTERYSLEVLKNSIKNQNYHNYIAIEVSMQKYNRVMDNYSQQNYYYLLSRIKKQCKLNSLVVFVKNPLLLTALSYINQNHQTHLSFVSYSKSQSSLQIHSFFYRIYELLSKNDFNRTNAPFLSQNNIQLQTLALLQISSQFAVQLSKNKIIGSNENAYFFVSRQSKNAISREQYTPISRLSHDMPTKAVYFNSSSIAKTPFVNGSKMSAQQMYRAAQRQQQWYLPDNHSIEQIQFTQFDKLYNISKYKNISRQVRFCVTVLSRNNIQNDRYLKVLKSIVQQKYENYHIVFIDDKSTDNNMNASIQYLKSINFPQNRVTYIQNLQRNYATYNIINAAFNYCHEDDVQMLMDGDDQFIGKYAFQVMNSAYQSEQKQNKQIWVAYSNYKSNFFTFGISREMTSDTQHMARNRRLYVSIFGPVRTWRVKVVYNIPPLHHKLRNGKWLDTVYDDALSHPLFQISSVKRVRYVAQILSQYNMKYGNNDDSTKQKIKHRSEAYRYVTSLSPLKTIMALQGSVKNEQIVKELDGDKNIKYMTVSV